MNQSETTLGSPASTARATHEVTMLGDGVFPMRAGLSCLRFGLAVIFAIPQIQAASKIIAVDVDGIIHPITVEILSHVFDQAASENATAVLIRLNTPGGLLDA